MKKYIQAIALPHTTMMSLKTVPNANNTDIKETPTVRFSALIMGDRGIQGETFIKKTSV